MTAQTQDSTSRVGLGELLGMAGFRRLLAVRLASQFGDGLFQAGLAWLILLAPERHQTPAAVAGAAVVILLPFTLVGPFAGVFLDRWSRRQVLVYGQAARVALVALLVSIGSATEPRIAEYALAVACLGVNRFCLAALSAGLPHVVAQRQLVTANAVAPTAGTIATLIGVAVGGLVLSLESAGSRTVLTLATVAFGTAGLLALRLHRDGIGPDAADAAAHTRAGVRQVAADLGAGFRHLVDRAPAGRALAVFGSYRFWYGLWTVQAAMLTLGERAYDLSAAAVVATASGAGFLTAAVVTPLGRARTGESVWITGALLVAGAAVALTSYSPAVVVLAGIGFVLGLVAQSLKICTDTALQRYVDDDHRGRAFASYDVVFNLSFVAAAGLAVLVVPVSGRTALAPLVAGAALTATACAYRVASRPS